jgi:HD-like signal output (HDOD) protein
MIGAVILGLLAVVVLWLLLRSPGSRGKGKAKAHGRIKNAAPGVQSGRVKDAILHLDVRSDLEPEPLPEALAGLHLVKVDEMDEASWAQVARICAAMGDPHPLHLRLAGSLDTPEELRDVVSTDGGLTVLILKTVNSAAFALASPITSVQHAVTYLGVGVVRGLVLRATLAEREESGTPEQQATLSKIWKSACSGSAFAQLLGQELGLPRPSVLATKSLFLNLGDVAIASSEAGAPAWYQPEVTFLERIDAQQRALGANTTIVGAALARHWNLPEDLALSIEEGFLPLVTRPGDHPMKGEEYQQNVLVYLANQIGDRITYRGLRNIADLELEGTEDPALYHLLGHMDIAGLKRVAALFREAAFRRKANRLIATLSPESLETD